jgi:hypothetical protein
MAAFWREKEMTIFFASMAHHLPEHASQAVSRERSVLKRSRESTGRGTHPGKKKSREETGITPSCS